MDKVAVKYLIHVLSDEENCPLVTRPYARANSSKSQPPDAVRISDFDKKLYAIAKTLIQSAFQKLDAFALSV